jgi:hypothetical protein
MPLKKNGASLKRTLRKTLVFSAAMLALAGSSGALNAFDPYYCPDLYRSGASEQTDCPDPCPKPYCPPASCLGCPSQYELFADFLYWQINPDGLEFARMHGISSGPSEPAICGGIFSPKCKPGAGFRVGLVIDLDCSEWDVFAQYTRLAQKFSSTFTDDFTPIIPIPPNGNDNGNFDPPQSLYPLIYNQGIGGNQQLTSAKGAWDSCINVLDFGMGRAIAVSPCFDFRPHFGLKASWQQLKYHVRYDTLIVVDEEEIVPIAADIRNKTDFSGIGLRGGFDASWNFTPCVSLVGAFALSALWSDIDTHRQDSFDIDEQGTVQNVDLRLNKCALIPVMEILLGFRYDTMWCDTDIFAFVGWENQVWWDMNRFIFIENNDTGNNYHFGPAGNISYQGLTVRGGFGF